MKIFNPKNIYHYIVVFIVIFIVGTFIKKIQNKPDQNPHSDLIREYLLNESPLYGYNRPKIWIHSKYELNARKWKEFYSRNTTDLNQPYIHLTIKSIINHCGDDFNICLIDDESFSNLLPDWGDIELNKMAEPTKSQYREIGMLRLLHLYGGLIIPNSFLCIKNLKTFYENGIQYDTPFVCETINNISVNDSGFIPSTYIMGSSKNNEIIYNFIEQVEQWLSTIHVSSKFMENLSNLCNQYIQTNKMNLINGEMVGIKSFKQKPILIDDLLNETYIELDSTAVGIFIPASDVLKRTKYQWFASLSVEEVLQTNTIISKYLMASIVDCSNDNKKSRLIKSVVSI
jgi:hypothetical protein